MPKRRATDGQPCSDTRGRSMPSAERLEELLALAQTYRGWTRTQLAARIGRDTHHLVPGSGVPRLDIVVELAQVLDWPVQEVIADLYGVRDTPRERPHGAWRELDGAAYRAYLEGDVRACLERSESALRLAATPTESAWSLHRIASSWDKLGQFARSVDAARRGLEETPIPIAIRHALRGYLANGHYTLGHLEEAQGVATCLLGEIDVTGADHRRVQAFAHAVRGHCARVMAGRESPDRALQVAAATADLERAAELYREVAAETGEAPLHACAATCDAGVMELRVLRGDTSPAEAIEWYLSLIDDESVGDRESSVTEDSSGHSGGRFGRSSVDRPGHEARDEWLESMAWACVYASNVVFRHVADPALADRWLAVFSNKADEIATRLQNWVLRRHVWTIEHSRRRARECAGSEWVIDREDVETIGGLMARFPVFRETGWQILRAARLVEDQ